MLSVDEDDKQEYRYRHDGGKHEVTLTDRHLPQHQHAYGDVYYSEIPRFKPSGVC